MTNTYDDSYLNLDVIEKLPERNDTLENQLHDVIKMCNQSGCWKAADFVQLILTKELWRLP